MSEPLDFDDQDDFFAWCFDEPHSGIHLLAAEPAPGPAAGGAAAPATVTLTWGCRDHDEEDNDQGTAMLRWRLSAQQVTRYTLDGPWTTALEATLQPNDDARTPMYLQMAVPGTLLIGCARIRVEPLPAARVVLPQVVLPDHFSFEQDGTQPLATLLAALGLDAATPVVSFSGRPAPADATVLGLRDASARAWRIGPGGGDGGAGEQLALVVDLRREPGQHLSVYRRALAGDALWERAWRLPQQLPGTLRVHSGNASVTPEAWQGLRWQDGIGGADLDPANYGRALEPDGR